MGRNTFSKSSTMASSFISKIIPNTILSSNGNRTMNDVSGSEIQGSSATKKRTSNRLQWSGRKSKKGEINKGGQLVKDEKGLYQNGCWTTSATDERDKTVDSPSCPSCTKKCTGEVLRVNESSYFHPSCFKCCICQVSLASGGFFAQPPINANTSSGSNNKLDITTDEYYCAKCYQLNFGSKCFVCNKFVEGPVVTALNRTYHQGCFVCHECEATFTNGRKVHYSGSKIFCENCISSPRHQKMVSSKFEKKNDSPVKSCGSNGSNVDSPGAIKGEVDRRRDVGERVKTLLSSPAKSTTSSSNTVIELSENAVKQNGGGYKSADEKSTHLNIKRENKKDRSDLTSHILIRRVGEINGDVFPIETEQHVTNNQASSTTNKGSTSQSSPKLCEISTAEKPICKSCCVCAKILDQGQALMALNKHFHLWCFKCVECDKVLHGEYMAKDDLPYCEKDYQRKFGIRCTQCQRYISGRVLQAGPENHFHPGCARCTKCGLPFGDGQEMFLQGAAIWHPKCGPPAPSNSSTYDVRSQFDGMGDDSVSGSFMMHGDDHDPFDLDNLSIQTAMPNLSSCSGMSVTGLTTPSGGIIGYNGSSRRLDQSTRDCPSMNWNGSSNNKGPITTSSRRRTPFSRSRQISQTSFTRPSFATQNTDSSSNAKDMSSCSSLLSSATTRPTTTTKNMQGRPPASLHRAISLANNATNYGLKKKPIEPEQDRHLRDLAGSRTSINSSVSQRQHFHLPAHRQRFLPSGTGPYYGASSYASNYSNGFRPTSCPPAKVSSSGVYNDPSSVRKDRATDDINRSEKVYPYHVLMTTNYKLPFDVDRCNLESHLSEEEFNRIFRMERHKFYTQIPFWRRSDMKRRARLF